MAKKSKIGWKYLKPRGLGVGGTIGEFKRQGKPPVRIDWRVGKLSGAGKGRPKVRGRGPGGRAGRLRGKSAPGFRFRVRF